MAYSITRAKEIAGMASLIGVSATSEQLNISTESVHRAIRYAERDSRPEVEVKPLPTFPPRPPMSDTNQTVLVIGDLHSPFDLESYYDHCCEVADKYQPTRVVFIGDVIDNHYASYHETDPDGLGGGDELELAVDRLARWHDRFPNADVIIGNHDRLIMRKAHSSAIPSAWIRSFKEVLRVPTWEFSERVVIDKVQYIHGEGGTARTKHKKDLMSTVQGHLHAQAYTEWTVGANYKIFGMQVGCGVNHETYAMAYARSFPKMAIGCGVVIDGTTAINLMMNLGSK